MTRTDVMASSRPRTAGAAKRTGLRRLAVLPVILMLGMALLAPGSALAAEPTTSTGYNQEPNKPTTGTSPSKETSTPSTTPSAEKAPSTTTPTTSTAASKTLPFTGLDLRWSFGLGLLLIGAGFSIVLVQRRGRSDGAR